MKKPKLIDYNVKALEALGNQAYDATLRDDIKNALVIKIGRLNYSMLLLLNYFLHSKDILREVYAELIMIRMRDYEFRLGEEIIDEIINLVSMDILTEYGMKSCSSIFSEKCKDEFWKRAIEIEDRLELIKKKNIDSQIKMRRLVIENKKGDSND